MKKIIEDFELFKGKYSCGYAIIYNIFAYLGLKVSETDMYFLSNGLSYDYISDGKCYFGYHSINNEIEHIKQNVTDKVEYYREINKELFLNTILGSVASKRLSMLFVYASCLDYHNIKVIRNPYHAVVVYGVDCDKNIAYIGDALIVDDKGKSSIYKGTIELDKLIENTIDLAIFHDLGKSGISRNDVFNSVNYNINKFYEDKYSNGVYKGKASLIKYLEDLEELVLNNAPLFNQLYENIAATIKWIRICPTFNYLATLFAENEALRVDKYAQILAEIEKIKQEWEGCALNIIKIGVSGKSDKIHSVIGKCNSLVVRQEEVLYALREHIKKVAS